MTDQFGFGQILHAGMVRDAVKSTIQYWARTYLDEMARLDGQNPALAPEPLLPTFRSYPDTLDASKAPEDQLPACLLVVPGIVEHPQKRGKGALFVKWSVGVGVVVSGPQFDRTIRLAQLYAAAVRSILVQHPGVNAATDPPFACGVEWTHEQYTDNLIRGEDTRTICAAMLRFLISTDEVTNAYQGPTVAVNDGSTPEGWPTIDSADVTVTGYPSNEVIPT